MATRLRLCRLPADQYAAPDAAGQPLSLGYPAVHALLGRLLPDVTVALFAEPVPTADGQSVDWCSSLPGQPVPLTSLSPAEQAAVLTRLRERLEQVQTIATRLGQTGDSASADRVARMAVEPAPEQVYVQNGEPVIVGWGSHGALPASAPVSRAAAAVPAAAAVAAVAAPAPAAAEPPAEEAPPRRPWWRWLLWLLPLLLLLAAILYFLRYCQEPPPPEPKKEEPPKAEEPKKPEDLSDLQEKIRRAEDELKKRLDACPAPEVLPKELPKEPDPFPPVKQDPPKQEPKPEPPKPEPPKPEPPKPEKKPEPPKPAPVKPDVPKAEPPKQDPPKPQAQACPPKPKPWEKPEVAILLDASGSMALPATMSNADARSLAQRAAMGDPAARARLTGGKGSRLEVAKDSVADLTRTIPPEVDLGLLVFGRCEGTDNYKFFSNAERPQMVAQVEKIQTQEGTPLARGLERAGNMIDGVSVPGTIVVVSDGEDSCGGDPCAVARALKQKKPNLKINVISVDGSGTGKCMAEISGGRVLKPRDGENWDDLMMRATDQAPRPPGCP